MSWDWEKLQQQQRKRGDMPPNMDELIQKINTLKIPGGSFWIVIVLAALMGSTMIYTVKPSEVGVIQRFGKYVRTAQPGLHFKLPAGIEAVHKVNVRRIETEEFGGSFGEKESSYVTSGSNVTLMLTGELNVALVPWIIQYRIKTPRTGRISFSSRCGR